MNIPDNCLDNADWYPWNEEDNASILDEFELEYLSNIDYTTCPECGGVLDNSEEEGYEHLIVCMDCCYILNEGEVYGEE